MEEADEREEVMLPDERHLPSWFVLIRDGILTLLGVGLMFNEAVIVTEPRISLLIIAAGLLGAPGVSVVKQLIGR